MPTTGNESIKIKSLGQKISRIAKKHGFTLAAAESLTGGRISCHLAGAPDSSSWYAGGVTSYETRIKYEVLGVPEGHPVIAEEAVIQMAVGVAKLMTADVAIAVSGVGGPDSQEGNPPGTTWIAAAVRGTLHTRLHHFDGGPEDVLKQTEEHALTLLYDSMVEFINLQEKDV